MAIDKSVSLNVIAKVRDYQRELATLPGWTEKQAAAAGRRMEKELTKSQIKAAAQAKVAAAKSAAAWKKVGGAIAAALTVRALQAGANAIHDMAQEVADLRNELADTATKSGLTESTLNGLRLAARGSGLEFKSMVRGLQALPKLMDDAAQGIGLGAAAYDRLGVSVKDADGNVRAADAVFLETVAALGRVENSTERAALAAGALGTSLGPRLLQAVGTGALDEFISQADQFGLDTGPAAMKAAEDWQRQQALLTLTMERGKAAIGDVVVESGALEQSIRAIVGITPILSAVVADATDRFNWWADAYGKVVTVSRALNPLLLAGEAAVGKLGDAVPAPTESTSRLADAFAEAEAALARFDASMVKSATTLKSLDDTYATSVVTVKESAKAQAEWIKRQKEAAREAAKAAKVIAAAAAEAAEATTAAQNHAFMLGIQRGDEATARAKAREEIEQGVSDRAIARAETEADAVIAMARRAVEQIEVIEAGQAEDAANRAQKRLASRAVVVNQLVAIEAQAAQLIQGIAARTTADAIQRQNERAAHAQRAAGQVAEIEQELASRRGEIEERLTNRQLRQKRRALRVEQALAENRADNAAAAALKAFNREQDLARVQAGVAAAILTLRLEAALALSMSAAAIPTAVALAGAQLAIQLAAINQQKPPTFHQGGLVGGARPIVDSGPDAINVQKRAGEGTLTPLGVASAGGEAGLNQLNRGGTMAQDRVTRIFLGDRLVDQFIERGVGLRGRGHSAIRREVAAGALPGMVRVY